MNLKVFLKNGGMLCYEPVEDIKYSTKGEYGSPVLMVSGKVKKKVHDLGQSDGLVYDKFTFDKERTIAAPIKLEFYE